MLGLVDDEDVIRFTRVPAGADDEFVRGWIGRYETGWQDGTRAGFAVRGADGSGFPWLARAGSPVRAADGSGFLAFAAAVDLDLDAQEAELGYMVAPAARGRGVAVRAL